MKIGIYYIVFYVFNSLLILVCVAFFTLMERKVLSYHQTRKGPNIISYVGLAQPASDALKLLTKEEMNIFNSNKILYWMSPSYSFLLFLLIVNLWGGGASDEL